MSKVIEKIVAEQLSLYYEKYFKLHSRQICNQKKKSAIDMLAMLVYIIQ